jgi:hypothetical protein
MSVATAQARRHGVPRKQEGRGFDEVFMDKGVVRPWSIQNLKKAVGRAKRMETAASVIR